MRLGATVTILRNKTITGEVMMIDDTNFVDCILIDCVLEYGGGPVMFERTQMQGCSYVFFGSARGFVQFLQSVGLMQPADRGCEANTMTVH
jgi:hypothetical protein